MQAVQAQDQESSYSPCRQRPVAGRAAGARDALQEVDTGGLARPPWVASPHTLRPSGGLWDSTPSRLAWWGVSLVTLGRTPVEASPGVCSSGSCLPELPELGRSWGRSAAPAAPASPQPQSGLGGFAQVPPLVSGSNPHFWSPSPSFSAKQDGMVQPPLPAFLSPHPSPHISSGPGAWLDMVGSQK